MRCVACGFVNGATASACVQCGTALPLPEAMRPASTFDAARCPVHPDLPPIGTCDRCGTFGCTVCLQGVPLKCPTCRATDSELPWDRRAEIGTLKAYWQTATKLIQTPEKTLATTSPNGSLGSSLYFAFLSTLAGYFTTLVLYMGLMAVGAGAAILEADKIGEGGDSKMPMLGTGIGLVIAVVGFSLFVVGIQVVSVLVLAGLEHLVLKLAGANPSSYTVSVRAHALSMSPYLVGLIPVCGAYVFPIWSMIVRGLALRSLHRTTGGKAALAVLSPVIFACLTCGIGYAALLAITLSMSKALGE